MKHVFKYLDFVEDREHVGSVVTKELKLDHVEKFAIRDLTNDIKERGCVELAQPGGLDELVQIYEAEGSEIELPNCGIGSRKMTITAPLRVIHEPDFQCLEAIHGIIRITRDLGAPVNAPLDC